MYGDTTNVEPEMIHIPVKTGAITMETKGLGKIWEQYQENIQLIHYKRQLYLNITRNKESAAV